jgi:hypothetical protein
VCYSTLLEQRSGSINWGASSQDAPFVSEQHEDADPFPEPDRVRSARAGVVHPVTVRFSDGRVMSFYEAGTSGGRTVACEDRASAFALLHSL